MQQTYDRAAEDLGNSVHLEHVNVQIPDQRIAGLFYVVGLGLTRDPYLNVADNNMWMNVGRSQFHLPTGNPQVLRGHTGIVMEGREALLARLAGVRKKLDGTRFDFSRAQRPRRGDLPLGQPHPLLRAGRGALRPHRARLSLCRVRRAGRHRQGHRRVLPRDDRHAGRGRERRRHRRARHGRQGPASPVPRDRPAAARLRRASHPDLRRGLLRPAPAAEASAASSTARTTSTSTASATSSISTAASTCSPSSTRCEASPIRCSCARWSTAIRRRPRRNYADGPRRDGVGDGAGAFRRPAAAADVARRCCACLHSKTGGDNCRPDNNNKGGTP